MSTSARHTASAVTTAATSRFPVRDGLSSDVINQILDELLADENYYEDKGLYATYYYAACDEAGILPDDEEE